jgi:uncharacterized repeat protein (TIGR01451 family)
MGAAVVAAGLFAAVALATHVVIDTGDKDVTVLNKDNSSGLVSLGTASVEYIGSSANNQSSGTGIFDPFVRLQADPTEQGFNTDAPVTLDAKSGKWTHAIKVNAIPVVDCDGGGTGTATCWELFVDINENNTAKRVSLNEVEIWFTDSATLSPYPFTDNGTTTKEYDFSGAIRINDVNQGSGRGDLRYLVPTAGHDWTADTWFVLYSQWGTTSGTAGNFGTGGYGSDGGFEEWKVKKTPNVSIVKTANPVGPVSAGTNIGFDITVSNTGVADATNVVISDSLPAGLGNDLVWSLSPAFPGCSITGAVAPQTLNCIFATLAAGGSIGPIQLTSPTTQADCALVRNTATVTSGNDGGGSSTAEVTVQCAAIKILKASTKTGNPLVANPGAVFAVDGPDAGTVADFSVTDNGTLDEDSTTIGSVCVGGLAPGTYTVNETTAPSGYGSASQTNLSVVAVQGTNCASTPPTGTGVVTFTNPPLSDIQVRFRDGGSGETSITSMTCDNGTNGTSSTTDTAGWGLVPPPDGDTLTVTGVKINPSPLTITCTIVIDP